MSSNTVSESSFAWSDDALSTKALFYDVDIILYVEGIDDIRFWEILFEKLSPLKIIVEDLAGCEKVKEMAYKISIGKIRGIAALDKDLHFFTNSYIQHSNVLYTKGYSIENTLINPNTLIKLICNLGKYQKRNINKTEILDWLENLYIDTKDLISLDIYTHMEGIGESIIGNYGDKFLNTSSAKICQEKLNRFFIKLKEKFLTDELLKKLRTEYEDQNLSDWLKGHFLFTSAHRFISHYLEKKGRKTNLSKEGFYATVLSVFEVDFNEQHQEYEYYQNQIQSIVS